MVSRPTVVLRASFPPDYISPRLSYQSVGVIYGDIGTSPLYTYSSTFSSDPSREDILGACSLIIWSLTIMVTIKYILIVLYADDEGEGGTFALYSLISRYVCPVLAYLAPRLACSQPTGKHRQSGSARGENGQDRAP